MTNTILKFLLCSISMCVTAEYITQDVYSIKGTIIDQTDSLIFANALLLNKADSSLIKGGFITNGVLFLDGIDVAEAILKIESIYIEDKFISIFRPPGEELNLGVIEVVSGIVLDEAEIVEMKPAFFVRPDGEVVINVKGSILESSTSLIDVLSKSPTVLVEDGVVSIFGKGEAIVLLNGKLISSAQLQTIAVSNIENIEILSNAPAKYDANGQAVINIKLVENPKEGFSGEINHSLTLAKHPQSYSTLLLNFRKNKLALQGSYVQDLGRNWGTNSLSREMYSDQGTTRSVNNFEDNSNLKFYNTYNIGTTYSINKFNSLSFEYSGSSSITEQDSKSKTIFLGIDQDSTIINTVNYGENSYFSNAFNLNYNHVLDTLGSSVFVGGQYFKFDYMNDNLIDETIVSSSEDLFNRKNISSTDISFGIIQADVLKYMKKNRNKLEFGGKIINAVNRGNVNFFSKSSDETDFDFFPSLSNDFKYSEIIGAIYTQYATKVGEKTSMALGIRSELTDANGFSKALNQVVIDSSYIDLFPNFKIGWDLNKDWAINWALSSTIKRPSYQALDPFIFYVDSLTTNQGNPLLKPEYAYSSEVNLNYKRYSLKMGYTLTNQAFRYALLPNENIQNSTKLMQINVEKEHTYFATLHVPLMYKFIQSMNVVGATLDQIDDSRPEFASRGYTPRVYLFSNNTIRLKSLGKLQVGFRYLGTRFDGIYYRKPAYNFSLGWSKNFFNDKLSCTFLADDIFQSFIVDGYYELSSSKVSYLRKMNTKLYRITLAYRFGKLKEPGISNVNVGKDNNKRIRR